MNCNECKSEMLNLISSDINKPVSAEMKEHFKHCPDCSAEYNRIQKIFTVLKPKFQPNAPFALKYNIIHQLKMENKKMDTNMLKTTRFSLRTKKFIGIAAVLAIIMAIISVIDRNDLFDNTAKATNSILASSIRANQLIKSMKIELKVRTNAFDNFALIGTQYDMVDHTIWKSFEQPIKWRVDKGKRIVVFDGKNQYLWIPQIGEGIKASSDANIIEWLNILLEPSKILEKEKNSINEKDSKITINEKDNEIHLTINSKAKGNFINDYCKNQSIEESDNRREYVFDNNTKLLKGLKIYILENKKETLILEIEKIDYNVSIETSLFTINLPSGIEWKENKIPSNNMIFKNINSKRAAELVFEGMANNDWKTVATACDLFNDNTPEIIKLKELLGGLEIIKIGEPFKSGLFTGEFVPYEVKLKSGEIRKANLAVRNDNSNQVWVVDGGI